MNTRFQNAANVGIVVKKSSLSLRKLLLHLVNGPIIALTNSKLLSCDICKLNKISAELRKCIPWPVPYQGHYIVICGYDINLRKIFYRNPSFRDRKYKQFEKISAFGNIIWNIKVKNCLNKNKTPYILRQIFHRTPSEFVLTWNFWWKKFFFGGKFLKNFVGKFLGSNFWANILEDVTWETS